MLRTTDRPRSVPDSPPWTVHCACSAANPAAKWANHHCSPLTIHLRSNQRVSSQSVCLISYLENCIVWRSHTHTYTSCFALESLARSAVICHQNGINCKYGHYYEITFAFAQITATVHMHWTHCACCTVTGTRCRLCHCTLDTVPCALACPFIYSQQYTHTIVIAIIPGHTAPLNNDLYYLALLLVCELSSCFLS